MKTVDSRKKRRFKPEAVDQIYESWAVWEKRQRPLKRGTWTTPFSSPSLPPDVEAPHVSRIVRKKRHVRPHKFGKRK